MTNCWGAALRAVTAAVLSLMLAGCMDVQHDLVVEADGTAGLLMVIAVDARMNRGPETDVTPRLNCSRNGAPTPEGVLVTYEQREVDGDFICEIRAHGQLAALASFISTNELFPTESSDRPIVVTLKPEGANYRFDLVLRLGNMGASNADAATLQRVEQATKDRSLSWSVTAPRIVETTGTLSADGKTASFSVPLGELLLGDMPTAKFSAEFSLAE